MSSHAAAEVAGTASRSDFETRLVAALEPEFLDQLGYVPGAATIAFPADHPTLGWTACPVGGCGRPSTVSSGLCPTCHQRWIDLGRPDRDTYVATTTRRRGNYDLSGESCSVGGCARPPLTRTAGLCQAHEGLRQQRGQAREQFCADSSVRPHARVGPCLVAACVRERSGTGPYCATHRQNLANARRRDPDLDEEQWRRTTRPVAEGNVLVLAGLGERVALELLYGLQNRHARGLRTGLRTARTLIDRARAREIASLADLPATDVGQSVLGLRNHIVDALERLDEDPRHVWEANRWSLEPFGHRGRVRFDGLTQPWLREAAKHWLAEDCPTRRGTKVTNNMQTHLSALGFLSTSLARHRDDAGDDHRRLGRDDIVTFLNRMAYLESTGTVSAHMRRVHCRLVRKMLTRMRTLGLTRPGRCLHGWPEDFALTVSDMPAAVVSDEPGRDVPEAVMATLVERLDEFETANTTGVRVAVELMMHTGRRPGEICELRADCLTRDGDNRPVLVWNNSKIGRYGRRLPITEQTAAIITAQHDRVTTSYPRTPVGDLALLPTSQGNPDGRRGIGASYVGHRHRRWVDTLALSAPVAVVIDGHTMTRELAYDPAEVILYSYRHSYAQRHADAGVAVDVLCELMDHDSMGTTQGYYRVSEGRRRDAVDRVTTMAFDRHGGRLWRQTEQLLDDEHARRGIGEVAVPYGGCTEPSNVAAGGGACPLRYRCVGCEHFRTDVSYLPDLQAYLADLRRNRERVLAIAADDWAKTEAMPSDDEIRRVRGLIDRVKTDLDDLDTHERAEIEQAVTTVRRARNGAVGLGMPRIQPTPTSGHDHDSEHA